jgi:hypothetical protein
MNNTRTNPIKTPNQGGKTTEQSPLNSKAKGIPQSALRSYTQSDTKKPRPATGVFYLVIQLSI